MKTEKPARNRECVGGLRGTIRNFCITQPENELRTPAKKISAQNSFIACLGWAFSPLSCFISSKVAAPAETSPRLVLPPPNTPSVVHVSKYVKMLHLTMKPLKYKAHQKMLKMRSSVGRTAGDSPQTCGTPAALFHSKSLLVLPLFLVARGTVTYRCLVAALCVVSRLSRSE